MGLSKDIGNGWKGPDGCRPLGHHSTSLNDVSRKSTFLLFVTGVITSGLLSALPQDDGKSEEYDHHCQIGMLAESESRAKLKRASSRWPFLREEALVQRA